MRTLSKNEQKVIDLGFYVAVPINLQILLTQSERDVLNSIRHLKSIGTRCISLSLLRVYTGLSGKTIQLALYNLIALGVLSKGAVCKSGTYYDVVYKKLYMALKRLRQERNPIERLRIADSFRGNALAIHKGVISEYTNSQFDTIN